MSASIGQSTSARTRTWNSARNPRPEKISAFAWIPKNFIQNVKEYAANFDIDEHIELWIEAKRNGVKGVPSTRELVYDAEAICKMLQELAAALAKEEPA